MYLRNGLALLTILVRLAQRSKELHDSALFVLHGFRGHVSAIVRRTCNKTRLLKRNKHKRLPFFFPDLALPHDQKRYFSSHYLPTHQTQ